MTSLLYLSFLADFLYPPSDQLYPLDYSRYLWSQLYLTVHWCERSLFLAASPDIYSCSLPLPRPLPISFFLWIWGSSARYSFYYRFWHFPRYLLRHLWFCLVIKLIEWRCFLILGFIQIFFMFSCRGLFFNIVYHF